MRIGSRPRERDKHPMHIMTPKLIGSGLVGSVVAVSILAATTAGQPAPGPTRGQLMRQKLVLSKEILAGLALEQFTTIEKSARALRKLSETAEWELPSEPKGSDFALLTNTFRRNLDDLASEARDRDIDGATLAYLRVTMNCVECHKFIRRSGK